MTDVLTPGIRETPAKDTNNNVEDLRLGVGGLVAKNGCLDKAMDR